MDFGFSDEQEMLRDSVRRFVEAECPSPVVRRAMESPTAHDPDLWRKIVELGWLGVLVPQEHGGLGGTFLDMAVVLEQTGKALLPGPFFSTAVLGAVAVREGGSREQQARILPALARGERLIAVACGDDDGRAGTDGVPVEARRSRGGEYVLAGEWPFVVDAHVADTVVVAARTQANDPASTASPDSTLTLFLVDVRAPGVQITPLKTVDQTRRQCRLRLANASVPPSDVLGAVGGGGPVVRRVLDHALAGLAVELVGTGQRALDMAVAYANERVQFGRPIGSFQAIKHKCVDMMVAVEKARSLAYYAAWAVSEDAREARTAVAMAKSYCGEMGRTVTSEAIQVHGGIGFTWEHDLHLYHLRALASEAAFGAALAHREAILDALVP